MFVCVRVRACVCVRVCVYVRVRVRVRAFVCGRVGVLMCHVLHSTGSADFEHLLHHYSERALAGGRQVNVLLREHHAVQRQFQPVLQA